MQKIAILYDASQAVLSTFDLDEVLSQILCIMRDYFHLQHVAILLMDSETQTLRARTHAGWNKESEGAQIILGRGLIGTAAKRRRAAQLEAINALSRHTTAVLDMDELLAKSCSTILDAFPVDHVAILLLEEQSLFLRAHKGRLTLNFPERGEIPAGAGLTRRAV